MNCESCVFYEFDDVTETWFCSVNLDEDEMAKFLSGANYACPYYRLDDEYAIVRKQA